MSDGDNGRRLAISDDVLSDISAIELVSVWFSSNKVRIMTKAGTGLDQNSEVWGEILAGIAANVAQCTKETTGASESRTLELIRRSLDHNWPEG